MSAPGLRSSVADMVLRNGRVLTLVHDEPVHQAVAVANGRIIDIGSDEQMQRHVGADTTLIDLDGRTAMPGIVDAHAHLDREGLKQILPSLESCRSIKEILAVISDLAANTEPGEWIVTMPLGQGPHYREVLGSLAEGRYPTRWDLDRVAPNNPVYIRPIWGYWRAEPPLVSIANSHALALAGIDRHTRSPWQGVEIEHDPHSGEPTGVFIEHTMNPIVEHTLMRVVPPFSAEDRAQAVRHGQTEYLRHGTTSVFEGHGVADQVLAAYRTIRDRDQLAIRANLMYSPSWGDQDAAHIVNWINSAGAELAAAGAGDSQLRQSGIFVQIGRPDDDALRATAMPETGWSGMAADCGIPSESVPEVLCEAAGARLRISMLGSNAIDTMWQVHERVSIRGQRWIVGHITTLTDQQIARAKAMGIVLTMHTNAFISNRGGEILDSVGESRESEIVPLASLLRASVPFGLGSDNVPVSLFGPVVHSIERRERHAGRIIAADQALSRTQALRAATLGGAFASFEEKEKGTIERGKVADFAVLAGDPLSVPLPELAAMTSELTIVGGTIQYVGAPREP